MFTLKQNIILVTNTTRKIVSPPQPLVSSTDTSTDTSDTETEEDSGTDTPVKNVTKKSK